MSEKTAKADDSTVTSGGPSDLVAPIQEELPIVVNESIHKGFSGEIKNQSELLDYTKSLEAKLVEANLHKSKEPAPTLGGIAETSGYTQSVAAPKVDDSPETLIYHDPKRAFEIHEQQIIAKINKENDAKAAQNQFWEDLYTENPDLRSIDVIVKSTMTAKWKDIQNLPVQEARKFLASESRKMVDVVKKSFGGRTSELAPSAAPNLGASGQPAPRIPAEPARDLTLAEQLLEARAARRKKA